MLLMVAEAEFFFLLFPPFFDRRQIDSRLETRDSNTRLPARAKHGA